MAPTNPRWPELHYADWRPTCEALHLFTQIVGKYRLAHAPWVNHSWHATLYVTPRGLTTGLVPDPRRAVSLTFDFRDHRVLAEAHTGARAGFALEPMSVADFWRKTRDAIEAVGGTPAMHGAPNELPASVPFARDIERRPYDAEAVQRFHEILVRVTIVLEQFRTAFIGKASPVHLYWGSFDLAVTRFSGRKAPRHPGGIPHLPDAITHEAYSHEVSSAGFWPGGSGAADAAFYSYGYPEPQGFAEQRVEPDEARYDASLREFLLPYEAVRTAPQPEAALLRFLTTTYEAAARCGAWDRAALEAEPGRPRVPRAVP